MENQSKLVQYMNFMMTSGRLGYGEVKKTPEGLKSFWIPANTSNRTATIDLNHLVTGIEEDGLLWGENGNCCTPYVIIMVPSEFNNNHIDELSNLVGRKLNVQLNDNSRRRILHVRNLALIEECISELKYE